MIKTSLGKYANPKLAQGAKVAILASVVDYLNGEEFVRIVTAPLNYTSPDFVGSTTAEQGAMGVSFSPTNVQQRYGRSVSYSVPWLGPEIRLLGCKVSQNQDRVSCRSIASPGR